ncbi:unnamed protein product [Danaus chrysippus]|uniref:(African queen) hypothetical protein n=1 Tax=Danaus chrysippus TaxID=151541 RepID=A0A8J2R4D1_9NEOP|nr:unnamed protein product [Danaus chrysippus]
MAEKKSILHELYVFSEWKPEPEYIQKTDTLLPENISSIWRWLKFFGLKKSLIDSVTVHKEKQQKWHMALGDEGKVLAILTDNILEIRTKRSEYATIGARTTVARDPYPQWRKLVWSPDCTFLVVAYGNGIVNFFDLTASNLFYIPADCSRPGGLECSDNTHAVSDIIFMPLRVKDTKWNWEVLVITFDGRLRGYLVSASEGFKLHHSFSFPGGVAAAVYCAAHGVLYVAGPPAPARKESWCASSAGLSAWRVLLDEPFYKLSVVSSELHDKLAADSWSYLPRLFNNNLDFIVRMSVSPDSQSLVCVHSSGQLSVWRLPVLSPVRRFALSAQPGHALPHPRRGPAPDPAYTHPADVTWWSNEEIILSRFSGAVSVCGLEDMANILGKGPEFFEGTPQVSCAHDGSLLALECESSTVPHKHQNSEVSKDETESEDSVLELTKELLKSLLYAITDIEALQPKPRRITVVSRIYRLLAIKSTTPTELFSRKIESGKYKEALSLAATFDLDRDLVYQQQWRRNPVSTDAIHNYLSKVSKKIWVVHQCVDRLPESAPAARHLLDFGLELTNIHILEEINKDLPDDEQCQDVEDITLGHLNAYTSELLRCRHVMLFYQERLQLYEAIIRCEKSTYVKDEYDRLRSNSIVHSAMEIAKEGRIEALTCLWPYIKSLPMQQEVLDMIPETLYPLDYQHLLPTKEPLTWFEKKSPIKIKPSENDNDWCKKDIFRSIWSSNWSEDTTPESETASNIDGDLAKWYEKRARVIEGRCGLVSHALTLVTIATVGGAVEGLENIMFHLLTLDTLIYDINVEGVTLEQLEKMSYLDTCKLLMKMSKPATFVSDLKEYVIPFLKRYENLTKQNGICLTGMMEFLESISVEDLSYILLVLQSPREFELDVRTHLELVERCLYSHTGTHQLHMACDLLHTILKETDGSISRSSLVRRASELERVVAGSGRLAWRGLRVPPAALRDLHTDPPRAHTLLARLARSLHDREDKPTQQDWENLLKDILELRESLLECITEEQCYEAYASALLTCGSEEGIRLGPSVLSVSGARGSPRRQVGPARTVQLVMDAAKEYFNSASSLTDPALELAKCCLLLIEDSNKDIEQELDLIAALPLLSAFNLTLLPIQVRLCEDRMKLIQDCLNLDPNAYLASHKLLKLAKLLRIAGDDEQAREGLVLVEVGRKALSAGAAGGGAASTAARRLAAIRHRPAAPLLADVAGDAHSHADTAERRYLLAAALTHDTPARLHQLLRHRMNLELESFHQMGAAARENRRLEARWPSTDDEFSDAITTPVIEAKDLVPASEKKIPLLNYFLETFQNKPTTESEKSSDSERSVQCQEFYCGLYPHHKPSPHYYRYDCFSVPDDLAEQGQAALKWFYMKSCLEGGDVDQMEGEVVTKCGEELVLKDTPLSVSCLVLGARRGRYSGSRASLVPSMYAALLHSHEPHLRDAAYRTRPAKMACLTLTQNSASEEQTVIIRQYIDRLSGVGEVDKVRGYGVTVNGALFQADPDYRAEVIYRLAKSGKEQAKLACYLAQKHGLDVLEVWLQYAGTAVGDLDVEMLPPGGEQAAQRIFDHLWPLIPGSDHSALINMFNVLKKLNDKLLLHGLTPVEHVKLLKKTRAASKELDYKLLVNPPADDELCSHVVSVCRPDTVGLVSKLLRSLPAPLRSPLPPHTLYTAWLTKYFFSVGESPVSSKKWMQQWRQCASYFNKLDHHELLKFVTNTCFTEEAIRRVPAGTRSLMIMQAVDYCQQEQENEMKFTKNEQGWSETGQELSRWGRFLDNYHSDSVAALRTVSEQSDAWPALELSRGEPGPALEALSSLCRSGLRASALASLLRCLGLPYDEPAVLQHALTTIRNKDDMSSVVCRVCQYHKAGVRVSEELVQQVLQRAAEQQLEPHKLLGVLAISRRARLTHRPDLEHVARSSVDLFRTEWSDSEYAKQLTEEKLMTAEGREEVYLALSAEGDTWPRKKALVDALACWPRTPLAGGMSAQGSLAQKLCLEPPREARLLLQLLLRRPMITDEELKIIANEACESAALNTIWVILLSKCECSVDLLVQFVDKHKEIIKNENIDDDLIRELLDQGMFIKMVFSPLYSFIINYIIRRNTGEDGNHYSVTWATNELLKANYLAEAGHLHLLASGVPAGLRGFTQTVLQYKNKFH